METTRGTAAPLPRHGVVSVRRALIAAVTLLGAALPGSSARAHRAWTTWSRLTYYRDVGYMYSGIWTFPGAAACGWAIPLYSMVTVHAAVDVTLQCLDRGYLSPTQIDAWSPSWPWWLDRDYAAVEVW